MPPLIDYTSSVCSLACFFKRQRLTVKRHEARDGLFVLEILLCAVAVEVLEQNDKEAANDRFG